MQRTQNNSDDNKPAGSQIPVIGFAAYSGTGKTTLLTQLIPILKYHGVRIGIIKHAHHEFDIDQPGKDSYRLRKAGAAQMLVASARRMALIREYEQPGRDPALNELIANLHQDELDLVLVEGFKHESFEKIELNRPSLNKPLLCDSDKNIIAIATDAPIKLVRDIDILDINNIEEIAAYILNRYHFN